MSAPRFRVTGFDGGVFLISGSILLYELLLTRVFSVTLFYHLAFLVVSLAMLGLGASGLLVHLGPSLFTRERLQPHAASASAMCAAAMLLGVAVAFSMPVPLDASRTYLARVGILYLGSALPFLFGGLALALVFTHRAPQANRFYALDLCGAAAGCLAFIPLTEMVGAPTAVLVTAALAAISGRLFAGSEWHQPRRATLALSGVLALTAVANIRWGFFDIQFVKGGLQQPVLAVQWNSFSRVEVQGTLDDLRAERPPLGVGYSKSLPPEHRVIEVLIRYDGDAASPLTFFDGDLSRLAHLPYDISSAPYHLRRFRNVLILGPGGGRDILTALALGSGPITGVEVNPLTLDLMRRQFRDFTGGLYDGYPGVRVIHDEGRSYLERSPEQFDLIQASLVDTWAASAAGAYALSENTIYTVEAFRSYLSHLTPDGLLSFTRWFFNPPVEALRLVSLAVESLDRLQIADPSSHVIVVRSHKGMALGEQCTVLVKRSPFTRDELARLRRWASLMGFVMTYAPDARGRLAGDPDFDRVVRPDRTSFITNYRYDITAVADDRPFFFERAPLLRWTAGRLGLSRTPLPAARMTLGAQTLLAAVIFSVVAAGLLLVVQAAAARRRPRLIGALAPVPWYRGRTLRWTVYFGCLGVGFITVETVLIQRLSLYLGYPAYTLSVVLFTMLLGSGLGSMLAARWEPPRSLPRTLLVICALLLLHSLLLSKTLHLTLQLPVAARITIAAAAVAIVAIPMGIPFPTALRLAGTESGGVVAWGWATNGVASVAGATVAMLVSTSYGFNASSLLGLGAYGLALVMILLQVKVMPGRRLQPE